MDLNQLAKQLAKDIISKEAELLSVLIQMHKENWFRRLGYPGIFDYVTKELKLSEAQAFYYKKVMEKSFEVPRLSEAVINGELSLSKARRIVPVVTLSNCDTWIKTANTLKQRPLESEVAKVNPQARIKESVKQVGPELVQMTISVTPEVAAQLKRVQDLEAQRTKEDVKWNKVMETMTKEYLEKHDPVKRAERLSSRKLIPLLPKPGRHAIAARTKHAVHLRDGAQCTEKLTDGTRCEERRWLELDHILPVHQGGLNTPENLRTLCGFHHRGRHERAHAS